MKSIIKEIAIVLLLAIAILITLGVLLYDYIPTQKTTPNVEPYKTPENVMQELQETVAEENKQVVVTYKVDDTDLRVYKKNGSYSPGKKNPFASIATENEQTNETDTNTTGNTTTNTNTVKNPDSTGTFYNNTGAK